MATLESVEDTSRVPLDQDMRATRRRGQYLHGPRLEHDTGHVSQIDIDAIFEPFARSDSHYSAAAVVARSGARGLAPARATPSGAQRT